MNEGLFDQAPFTRGTPRVDDDRMIKREESPCRWATDDDLIAHLARKGYCVADINTPRPETEEQ